MIRTPFRLIMCATVLWAGVGPAAAQKPVLMLDGSGKKSDVPDEQAALVKAVQEAYKAQIEVDKDIRDELRKQYQDPNPKREQKILTEVRRLYVTSPEQEGRIVQELRRAYDARSPEQEERVFSEIRRMGKLPPGTVSAEFQSTQAEKLFTRYDANRDGVLSADELPEGLRANAAKWDTNRDGVIDTGEYWNYYRASLKTVSDKVASGEIAIKLPGGATVPKPQPTPPSDDAPLTVYRAGKLPPGLPNWFGALDTDGDGQVGLYEWRAAGRNLDEFTAMDLNGDGLITPEEYLRWKKDADALAAKGVVPSQRVGADGKPVAVKPTGPTPVKPGITTTPLPGSDKPDKAEKKLIKELTGQPPPKADKPGKDKGGEKPVKKG